MGRIFIQYIMKIKHVIIIIIILTFMSINIWESLPKNQTDSQTILEAIAELIAEHENDPDAHNLPDQSLSLHRVNSIIDHPAGSVKIDKSAFASILYRLFFSDKALWPQINGANSLSYGELNITPTSGQTNIGVYQALTFSNDLLYSVDNEFNSYIMSIQLKFPWLATNSLSYFGTLGVNVFEKNSTEYNGMFTFNFNRWWLDCAFFKEKYIDGVFNSYTVSTMGGYLDDYGIDNNMVYVGVFNEVTEETDYYEICPIDYTKYNLFQIQYRALEHTYYYYVNNILIFTVSPDLLKVYSGGDVVFQTATESSYDYNGHHYDYYLYEGNNQQFGVGIHNINNQFTGQTVSLFDPIISIDPTM